MQIQRHNLYLLGEDNHNFPILDVGYELAAHLQKQQMSNKAIFDLAQTLEGLIAKNAQALQNTLLKGIILKNFVILCEPILALNVEGMLLDLSKRFIIVLDIEEIFVTDKTALLWKKNKQVAMQFEIPLQTL